MTMMNPMALAMRQHGAGEGLGAVYTPAKLPPGWYEDYEGNIYDQTGFRVYGPDVKVETRPLSVESSSAATALIPYTLPGGQVVQLTAAQYQQLQATQSSQNLVSGGVTSSGIQIGNTNISWIMIAVAVLGIMLLQHPGVQKR